MAKILIVLLILLTTTSAFGQDVHYSQYFNCPLSLNPAETGIFDGDWRAIGNYRSQWSSLGIPYNTLSASYDKQLYLNNHHFSPGFFIMSDNSGNPEIEVTMAYASLGYHQTVNKNYFSLGLQIGVVNKNLDYNKLTFPDQFDIYNPNNPFDLPTNAVGKDNVTYADINIGAAWSRIIKNLEPEIGISLFHLNNPHESFFDDKSSREPMRKTFYATLKTNINQNTYIKPGILLFSIAGANDMMIGSQFGFNIPGNSFNVSNTYCGIYMRNGIFNNPDAIMLMAGAQVHKLNIAISYDINVSPLSTYTNYRGAFEISIIYKSISSIIKTFTIPCERI